MRSRLASLTIHLALFVFVLSIVVWPVTKTDRHLSIEALAFHRWIGIAFTEVGYSLGYTHYADPPLHEMWGHHFRFVWGREYEFGHLPLPVLNVFLAALYGHEYESHDFFLGRGASSKGETFYTIGCPYWLVVAISGAAAMGLLYLRRRAGVRVAAGLCRRCGYDLRASPGRCPECGTAAG